jgi:hypothetical protein
LGGGAIIVAAGMMLAITARPTEAANPNRLAFPPRSHPYGKSYGNWGAAWWNWAGDFPLSANPITEGSGPVEYGDAGDQPPGQVWFLAGTFGDGAVERDLTVPEGKALFFPLANFVFWAPEDCGWLGIDEEDCDAEHLTSAIEEWTDANYDLVVEVDDESLNNLGDYRATSAPFALDILEGSMWNDFGYEPGVRDPTVSGGHWMFLKPLPVGEHVVHFEARNSNAGEGWVQDVTYNLTVEED